MTPPPKLPRAPTSAHRHRDDRTTHTPPTGIAAQLAAPTGKSRQPTTADLERTEWGEDEHTPVGGTALDSVDWRTQQIRSEMRTERGRMRQDLATLQERMHTVSDATASIAVSNAEAIGALTGTVGRLEGQVTMCVGAVQQLASVLVPIVTQQATAGIQQATLTTTSTLKIQEAEKLDVVDARKWRRVTFGTAIGSGGILLVLTTYLMGRC